MNKRISKKIFKRAQEKLTTGVPFTALEEKVWKQRNDLFLKVIAPIINKLTIEEA